MKYFAIIDGEKRGPFELDRLAEAGVRPSTYVWCKGMADWERAEDVADICRMYRGRLYDLLHPKVEIPQQQNLTQGRDFPTDGAPSRYDYMLQDERLPSIEEIDARQDTTHPPQNMLWAAILVTVLFFPPLGLIAILYAVASRKCWRQAVEMSSSEKAVNEKKGEMSADDFRRLAHDYCRSAKMWTGITFFIGLILYGFLFSKII